MNLTNRKSYWFKVFVALTLLLASLFGARMYESVCAAAWRLKYAGGIKGLWANITIWLMDFLEEDHCKRAFEYWATMTDRTPEEDDAS